MQCIAVVSVDIWIHQCYFYVTCIVLEMTVAMPAVPRTVLLNNRHNRLQIEMRNPQTIKFFYNPWILTKHRIDADIGTHI